MTTVIPAGHAQVVIEYTGPNFFSGRAQTVYGIQTAGVTVDGIFANSLLDMWQEAIGGRLDTETRLARCTVITPTQSFEGSQGASGGAASELVQPNTAVLVSKRTAFRGRGNRGRMFLPPIVTEGESNDDGTMTGTTRDAIQVKMNELLEAHEAADAFMVILHDSESATADDVPTLVTSLVVSSRFATQRRRLRR